MLIINAPDSFEVNSHYILSIYLFKSIYLPRAYAYRIRRRLCFQSFCPSVHGGGGVRKSALWAHCCYKKCSWPLGGGGSGGWVSRKVHFEHIVATKVLMPFGGGGVRESTLWAHCCYKSTDALWGGDVRESTLWAHCCYKSTDALWGGGGPGKCTLSTLLLQKCCYQREVYNRYSNCLLVFVLFWRSI